MDLTILRRPKETPVWQLGQRMRSKPCSEARRYAFKRGHLVRLRRSKVTTKDDGESGFPAISAIAIDTLAEWMERSSRGRYKSNYNCWNRPTVTAFFPTL